MKNLSQEIIEKSLREKLSKLGNPSPGKTLSVEITKEEAVVYEIDVQDEAEDDVIGSEGGNE